MTEPVKLYLIRHGQTDWNIAGKIQGGTDIPLNERGLFQARCLAEGMKLRPVTKVFSSRLKRAADTAAEVAGLWHMNVEYVDGLEEVGFGDWEGLTWEEIKNRFPAEYERWWQNPVDISPPGGELRGDIRERVRRALEEIFSRIAGDTAIISHGAIMAYMVEYLMGEKSPKEGIIVENASITTIGYNPFTREFLLLQSNDTKHLDA